MSLFYISIIKLKWETSTKKREGCSCPPVIVHSYILSQYFGVVSYPLSVPHDTSQVTNVYLKTNPVEGRTLHVCRQDESCLMLLFQPPLSLPLERELRAPLPSPPRPPHLSISFFFYPGKPPASLLMTHSTRLLYCTVGGLANPNNNLDPILPEHLSAKCSHKKSKPHTVIMTNFDG